jgi:serine/threonine protein kinase
VPDILAIVSKAIFERDARALEVGDIWPVDRYTSTNKALQPLGDGGRIFLVTVRPPNEQLWLVGVLDGPRFDGSAWIAEANRVAVTNITALRKTIRFESGKGISQDKGTLGMSLQTPRVLAPADVEQILAATGSAPRPAKTVVAKPPPRAPARIIGGKYEILRELGRGGMGIVYEARHTGTGRKVAVKEIVGDALKEPNLVERFQREARATGAIDTRHIAPVLDTGSEPPFLVMELLHGEDLQELIVRSIALPEPLALKIVAQACAGLARAHEAGVVHRDVKPANLFLARRDGEIVVKVLDFGVARVKEGLAALDNRALTVTGVMLGTPLYMAPEQVMGAKDLDHRADLWSLGVVLYEALAGMTPYEEIETLGALLVAICGKPARPLREAAPEVSAEAASIVERALVIDRDKRYASADAMLADLRRVAGGSIAIDESMIPPPPGGGSVFDDPDSLGLALTSDSG